MKIEMSTAIHGVGGVGEIAEVDARLGRKLVEAGHAVKVAQSANVDEVAAEPPPAPAGELVVDDDPKAAL